MEKNGEKVGVLYYGGVWLLWTGSWRTLLRGGLLTPCEHYVFFQFWNWNRALATVSCAFCRPHFPKVFWTLRFFNILKCKPSSRYSPVHFLSTTFPDRGLHPQTETPLRPPQKPLYPTKAQGFAPQSLFTREFTRSRTVTLSNYDGWLTWWCGWHDGGNASPHNRP